jgi:3-hydroxyisobutyrate dehydrogenase-like beta-hydroxyacid dehydrogenase
MPKGNVGFIGLGIMGKSMASNLIKNGFDPVVYDLRREPVEELRKMGAKVATSPKQSESFVTSLSLWFLMMNKPNR